ncbi:hypothetical protein D3C72_1920850 [compost metagenome]
MALGRSVDLLGELATVGDDLGGLGTQCRRMAIRKAHGNAKMLTRYALRKRRAIARLRHIGLVHILIGPMHVRSSQATWTGQSAPPPPIA